MEKMIDRTNGSPAGWIAPMQIAASGLLPDIIASSTSPASMGTMPCEMMTSLATLPSSWAELHVGVDDVGAVGTQPQVGAAVRALSR